MIDTECLGSVTTKLRPLEIVVFWIDTASGREKSLAVLSDGAVIVFTSARGAGVTP